MTSQRLETESGAARRLLAAVVGFVLALLGLVLASGPAAAQERVGAQPVQTILAVDPHGTAGQESVGVRGPPLRPIASATGVAAETGALDLPASTTWGRADSLTDHFVRHGADFGASTEAEYAQQASSFFQRGIQDGLPIKINPKDGSIRMYDPQSNTFGAYNANGTTRTFYKPDPAQHGHATNWDYWVAQPGYAP